jgi:hypothetical protein
MSIPTTTPPETRTASDSDGAAYLSRVGFILYFITLIGSSLLLCDCGAIPGIIMAACSPLPLIFGSRLQRIAAAVCLIIACVVAFLGYRSTISIHERAEHVHRFNSSESTPNEPSRIA